MNELNGNHCVNHVYIWPEIKRKVLKIERRSDKKKRKRERGEKSERRW